MRPLPPPDVVVVGGGVVGLYTSLALLRRQPAARVTLVEAGPAPAGAARGGDGGLASGAGQGYLWLAHRLPGTAGWRAAAASKAAWEVDVAAGAWSAAQLTRRGALLLAPHADGEVDSEAAAAALRAAGVAATALNATAVAAAEPALARLPRGAGALAVASDAQIDGRGACDALKAACEREGGGRFEVVASRRVAAVERASDGRAVGVRFDDATDPLPATTAVVVAAGAWTGEVLAASGVGQAWAGAFAPRKGHLIEVDAPPLSLTAGTMEAAYGAHYGGAAVEATGAFALTDDERARGVVFTAAPTADGARLLLGSSRDDGAGFDAGVDEAAVAAILARAGRFVPAARGARVVGVRVGLRPACRFGAPVVGPLTSWNAPNLYVAAGHEGSGLLLAAGTARAVAGGVFGGGGEEEAAVWAEFAPERVAGELLSV